MPSFTQSFSLSAFAGELPHGTNPPVLGGFNVAISSVTATSLVAAWTCPSDDLNHVPPYQGRPPAVPLTYQVSWRRECDIAWNFTPVFQSQEQFPSQLITGLAPATQYIMRVHHSGATPSLPFRAATLNSGTDSPDGACVYDPPGVLRGGVVVPTKTITLNGHVWGLETDASFPYVVSVDGVKTAGNEAILLIKTDGTVCYMDKSHRWWQRINPTDTWINVFDPRIGVSPQATLPAFTGFDYVAAFAPHALPVLDALKIIVIYRGPKWNNGAAGIPLATAQQKLLDTFASPAFSNLSEYGIATRPVVLSQQVDPTNPPPDIFDPAEAITYLTNAIKTGVVPYRSEIATDYMMIYPSLTVSGTFGSATGSTLINDGVTYWTALLLNPPGQDTTPPHQQLQTIDWFTGDLVHEIMDLITDPGNNGEFGWQGLAGAQAQLGINTLSNIQHINSPGQFVNGIWYWGYFSNLARKFIIPQ